MNATFKFDQKGENFLLTLVNYELQDKSQLNVFCLEYHIPQCWTVKQVLVRLMFVTAVKRFLSFLADAVTF